MRGPPNVLLKFFLNSELLSVLMVLLVTQEQNISLSPSKTQVNEFWDSANSSEGPPN